MANNEKSTFKEKKNGIKLILENPTYVLFDVLDSIKTFPEYLQCDITDIKKRIIKDT